MRSIFLTFFLCLFLAGINFGYANPADLNSKITKLADSAGANLNIGIYIESLDNPQVKFALHERRLFMPASTTKLFTAYMALSYLGPDYRFKTTVSSTQKPKADGKLDSDLHIKFVGDPTLKYEDLVKLFTHLKLTRITGDIIIDNTIFDSYGNAPGGFTWDDRPFYYAAPNSAVIINKNCSEAHMVPSEKGGIAKLSIDSPHLLSIDNTVETVAPRSEACPYKSKYMGANKYSVYGCMFNNLNKPIRLNFALQDNELMIKSYITQILKELNIKLKGQIKFDEAKGSEVLYTHESVPLKEILVDVLQDSCNITSAAIFKHIAAVFTKKQGTDEDGALLMKELLVKQGIKKSLFKIYDGAGESRYNLIAPKAFVELLNIVHKNSKFFELFTSSLPQYADEGTLQYRKIKGPYSKDVYAKTGTLYGTSALSGFYLPKKGQKYAFSIMINNHGLDCNIVKALVDDILYLLLSSMPR